MRIPLKWSWLPSCHRSSSTGLALRETPWRIATRESSALPTAESFSSLLASACLKSILVMCRVEGINDVDLSRHFSYYAFEGQSGTPRWKHEVWPISVSAPICIYKECGIVGR